MKTRIVRILFIMIALMLIGVLLFLKYQNTNQPTSPIPVLSSTKTS